MKEATRDQIREYALRMRWVSHVMEESDTAYWEDHKRRHGQGAAVEAADRMRRSLLTIRPDWPDEEARAEDLARHIRVADALRRAQRRRR